MSSPQKTFALIVFLLLVAAGTGLIAVRQFVRPGAGNSDLQGFWEGSVMVGSTTLRLVLKVDKAPEGTYTATIDSIEQGAQGIPVNSITLSNSTVLFRSAALRARYRGNLNPSATEIAGEWQQAGSQVPVTFKRTKSPSSVPAPLPPSAYAHRKDSPLQGVWKGTLEVGVPVRIVVKISETAPGTLTGTMDSPEQGARSIPLRAAENLGPKARFEVASINGEFEGTMLEDQSAIEGMWSQGGNRIPCLLTRGDAAEGVALHETAYRFTSDTELQGVWQGTLKAGTARLRLLLKIARVTNGTYHAFIDSPDQAARNIQASAASFNAPQVMLEWPALRALFHGELRDGRLVGFWQQGANDFPIEFDRTNRWRAPAGYRERTRPDSIRAAQQRRPTGRADLLVCPGELDIKPV